MTIYYATRDLTYNGQSYKVGEKLNHRTGPRNQQILKTMVRMRKLTVIPPVIAPNVDAPNVDTAPPPPSPLQTSGPALEHVGSGWYNITLNGTVLNESKLKGKENALNWAKENDVKLLTA